MITTERLKELIDFYNRPIVLEHLENRMRMECFQILYDESLKNDQMSKCDECSYFDCTNQWCIKNKKAASINGWCKDFVKIKKA